VTRSATDVDVVVIGGGILGMCVAMIAARASADVVVCRLSDARVPHADTLRNQSWLQSGLRYVGDADMHDRLLFAKRMRAARQLLHDELGFALPGGFGVFRMRDEADAADLERKAAMLGVAVHRLRPEDAYATRRTTRPPRSRSTRPRSSTSCARAPGTASTSWSIRSRSSPTPRRRGS
jgi:glycine/D-amino acid oxidase-like deaminating enzyme